MFKVQVDDKEVWGPSDFAIVFVTLLFYPIIRLALLAAGRNNKE